MPTTLIFKFIILKFKIIFLIEDKEKKMLKFNRKVLAFNSSNICALKRVFSSAQTPDVSKLNAESSGYNFGNFFLVYLCLKKALN